MDGQLHHAKAQSEMKCTTCHNGVCVSQPANTMFDKGESIVVLKNVPAMVCNNCGAKYFDAETTRLMLKKVKEVSAKGTELEILNLKAA